MSRLCAGSRRGFALVPLLVLLLCLGLLWKHGPALLGQAGAVLVRSEAAAPSDAIVVLAGGWGGERILKASQLARDGYAPLVLVSDAVPFYEQSECALAIGMAVRHGGKRDWFTCTATNVRSTREEAAAVVRDLRARGVRRYILVTTEFHTRRAARLFRSAAPELQLIPVAAGSRDFQIERWYESRQGRKTVLLEWLKTVTGLFGI